MSVVLNTPAADLGDSCKVYTCGEAPKDLMAGLSANQIQPKELAPDTSPVAAPAPKPQEFLADFKSPTPGMGG